MKSSVLQVGGIIMYELRMQWRRRILIVILSVFLFSLAVLNMPIESSLTDQFQNVVAKVPTAVLILLALIPAMTAEIIPLDRQLKLHDLLRTLPLSRAAYLTGKVLSVWLGLLSSMVLIAAGLGAFVAATSTLDAEAYINLWLLLLPHILMAASVPILAASILSSRRQAALMSLLIAPYLLIFYIFAVLIPLSILSGFAALAVHLVIVVLIVWLTLDWQERRA
jgi:ABC-type transport system involved in multi-copper enzyme maturation permease subunit